MQRGVCELWRVLCRNEARPSCSGVYVSCDVYCVGMKHGRRATWVGASGDQTFVRIDESLINVHTLSSSSIIANQSCIGIYWYSISSPLMNVLCVETSVVSINWNWNRNGNYLFPFREISMRSRNYFENGNRTEIVIVIWQESSAKLTNQRVSYAFTSSPLSFHARHILPTSKFPA